MLLRSSRGGLLVLATAPAGGASPHAGLAAIQLLAPDPAERITLAEQGLDFEIPARWTELEPADYAAPDRLARFTVEREELKLTTRPSAYQRVLLETLSRLVANAQVDDRLGEVAGREARLVTIRGTVRGSDSGPPARIECALFTQGRVQLALTAVAIGTGLSNAELDDVWGSVRWQE